MNNEVLMKNLRCIPDWPIKGVNFRDVTTLFKSAECLRIITNEMVDLYKDKGITKIVGIESRGFVMSSAVASSSTQVSCSAASLASYPARPYRRATPRSMASTPSKSTRTPSTRTMWCCSTTTCSLPAEP